MTCGLDADLGHFVHRYPEGSRRCYCSRDNPGAPALPARVGRNPSPKRRPKRKRAKGVTARDDGSLKACAIDLLVELQPLLNRLPASTQASAVALRVAVNAVEDEEYEERTGQTEE